MFGCRRRELISPDGRHLAGARALGAIANRDAARVNKQVKLTAPEQSDPVKPLEPSSDAGPVYSARWQAMGGQAKAATS